MTTTWPVVRKLDCIGNEIYEYLFDMNEVSVNPTWRASRYMYIKPERFGTSRYRKHCSNPAHFAIKVNIGKGARHPAGFESREIKDRVDEFEQRPTGIVYYLHHLLLLRVVNLTAKQIAEADNGIQRRT